METKLNKKTDNYAELEITVPASMLDQAYTKELKKQQRTATMKGFRAGKVPLPLLKKLYGPQMRARVLFDEINTTLQKVIQDDELRTLETPIIHDFPTDETIDSGDDIEIKAGLMLAPELDVALNKDVTLKYVNVNPSEAEVADFIEKQRQQHQSEASADVVGDSGLVKVKMTLPEQEEAQDALLPLVRLSESGRALFAGKKVGDTVKADIKELFDEPSDLKYIIGTSGDELPTEGTFKAEVTEITGTQLAEMNAEFFDIVFPEKGLTTEEEFNKAVVENFQTLNKPVLDSLFFDELFKHLVKEVSLDVDDTLLKRFYLASGMRNAEEEEASEDSVTDEQLKSYAETIKWKLVSDHLIKKHEISFSAEELNNQILSSVYGDLRNWGMSADNEQMASLAKFMIERIKGDKEQMRQRQARAYSDLLIDKMVALAKENITLEESEVTFEELRKLAQPDSQPAAEAIEAEEVAAE